VPIGTKGEIAMQKEVNLILFNKKPKKEWGLLLILLPFLVYLILFKYVPLAGWYLAFVDYKIGMPIQECEFVGFAVFKKLFVTGKFANAMKNTLIYSGLGYLTRFLPPILAILLNEVMNTRFKRSAQTLTTLPHFISWVIVYSLAYALFSTEGPVNELLSKFGTSQNLLTNKKTIYGFMTITGLWKNLGWDAIIYLAAITSIDPTLYEAASIDGAGYFKKAIHITLPGIMPTFTVLLLLGVAALLNNDMDKLYAFQNKLIFNQVETLEMYTYNRGIKNYDYSYSTAVGIFQSTVSLVLLFVTNWIAKKIRGSSII
jgi:putative aldouronate transport system permease protein